MLLRVAHAGLVWLLKAHVEMCWISVAHVPSLVFREFKDHVVAQVPIAILLNLQLCSKHIFIIAINSI